MVHFHRAKVVLALLLASLVLVATSAPPEDLRTATRIITVEPGATIVGTLVANRQAVRRTESSEIEVLLGVSTVDAGTGERAVDLVFTLNDLPSRVTSGFTTSLYPDWHALCDRDECALALAVTNAGAASIEVDVTANMRDIYEGGLVCGGGGTYPEEATITLDFGASP